MTYDSKRLRRIGCNLSSGDKRALGRLYLDNGKVTYLSSCVVSGRVTHKRLIRLVTSGILPIRVPFDTICCDSHTMDAHVQTFVSFLDRRMGATPKKTIERTWSRSKTEPSKLAEQSLRSDTTVTFLSSTSDYGFYTLELLSEFSHLMRRKVARWPSPVTRTEVA